MSTKTRSTTRAQPGIQRFTRASKPGAAPASKSLLLDGKKASNSTSSCQLTASPSKKRKLNEIANDANAAVASVQQETPSKTLKFSDLSVSTPRSSRVSRTPSKTSKNTRTTTRSRLPKSSVKKVDEPDVTRPAAFTNFANLHSSFLKAISLHSAHNSSSTSADLRELLPSIEKIWKKRKVVIKDLQRIVHVWDRAGDNKNEEATEVPRFRVANYGLGKICLERVNSRAGSTNLFDENIVQDRFMELLDEIWRAQTGEEEKENENAGDLNVDKLDLAPIHECLTPFTTFRKGQQRLQDLKGGVIKAKTAMLKAAEPTAAAATPAVARDPVADRRKGLFERIQNKQLLQAKLGPAPTKEQLLRRSASQRVEDVARVLSLLRPSYTMSGSGSAIPQRKPFIWQSLIQTVQDSLRNPIPAEEIGACLDILAQKDVANDWIDVVTIGSLKSVVLISIRDVSPKEIGIKVSKMQF